MLFTFQYTESEGPRNVERNLGPLYEVERVTLKAACGSYIYRHYFQKKTPLIPSQRDEIIGEHKTKTQTLNQARVDVSPAALDTTLGLATSKSTGQCSVSESIEVVDTEETGTSSSSSSLSTYILPGEVINGEYIPTNAPNVKFLPLYQLGLIKTAQTVGKGAFGEVSRVVTVAQGSGVIKKISRVHAMMAIKEEEILKMIEHPNIIRLDGCYFDTETFVLFFNTYCPTKLVDVQYNKLKQVLIEIALSVHYIHGLQILHRDIKPCNIMVDTSGRAKLLDFGLAKVVEDRTFTECGTEGYMAPEIGKSAGYTASVDVYALAKTSENVLFFNGTEFFDEIFANPATRPSILGLRDMLWKHPDSEEET